MKILERIDKYLKEAPVITPLRGISINDAGPAGQQLARKNVDIGLAKMLMDDLTDIYPELEGIKVEITNRGGICGQFFPGSRTLCIKHQASLLTFAHELAHHWYLEHNNNFNNKMNEICQHIVDLLKGI